MKMQADMTKRVIALSNLEAICERISGICHTFSIEKVTANRVTVAYSNPNEYGTPYPVYASYPAYPSGQGSEGKANPFVVLDLVRVTGGNDSEDWQAFEQITDCPILWRNPANGEWSTGYEIRVQKHPEYTVRSTWDKGGCIQTYYVGTDLAICDRSFRSFREASEFADARMIELERSGLPASVDTPSE